MGNRTQKKRLLASVIALALSNSACQSMAPSQASARSVAKRQASSGYGLYGSSRVETAIALTETTSSSTSIVYATEEQVTSAIETANAAVMQAAQAEAKAKAAADAATAAMTKAQEALTKATADGDAIALATTKSENALATADAAAAQADLAVTRAETSATQAALALTRAQALADQTTLALTRAQEARDAAAQAGSTANTAAADAAVAKSKAAAAEAAAALADAQARSAAAAASAASVAAAAADAKASAADSKAATAANAAAVADQKAATATAQAAAALTKAEEALQVAQAVKNVGVLNVKEFGAKGDGVTDDTAAIRACIAKAETMAGRIVIDFSGPPVAYKCGMVAITRGDLELRGGGAKIIQTLDSSCRQIGGADYTVSAVFFAQRGAKRIKVDGFHFTQDGSFDGLSGFTTTSNFSPVVVHRADYVDIDNCTFDCKMGRGVLWRGGNYGRLGGGCVFLKCGISAVVGNVTDAYYGDPVSDTSRTFSPIGLTVEAITIIGSSTTSNAPAPIHLSGCDQFTLRAPKLMELNQPAAAAIRIYAGDFGVSDLAGNSLPVMRGAIEAPQVYGTVLRAIEVINDSLKGTDVDNLLTVDSPIIDVTGVGFYAERFVGGKLVNASIRSTSSPLAVADSWENSEVTGTFRCTGTGLSNVTLWTSSSAELKGINWHHMWVGMAANDVYALNTTAAASDIEAGSITDSKFVCASTSLSARIVQIGAAKRFIKFSRNEFDIQAAGINNRALLSIAASGLLDIEMNNNKAYSTNGMAFQSRGASINSGRNLEATGNDIGGMDITLSGEARVSGGRIALGIASVSPLRISNAARADVSVPQIEQTLATSAVVADFTACGKVKLHHSSVKATNSSVPVVRAATSGVVEVDQVDVGNAGSGAPYSTTGAAKIAGNLGSYYLDATPWTDANRLNPAIFLPGTVFWNSSDGAPNYSDGTTWKDAVGVSN